MERSTERRCTVVGHKRIGGGTVFRLNKDGSGYRVLHTFGVQRGTGMGPFGSSMVGNDGVPMGRRMAAGTAEARNGVVFKLNPHGSGYTVLHSFPKGEGMDACLGRAAKGRDRALYGTTSSGGHKDLGTVFELNKDGNGYRLLHSFSGQSDQPNWPEGWMEEKPVGKPVGLGRGRSARLGASPRRSALWTTGNVGKNGGGTAFKLNPDGGGFTILHAFPSIDGDGKNPHGRLIAASDGAWYGMTQDNSTNNCATVFRLSSRHRFGYRTTVQVTEPSLW